MSSAVRSPAPASAVRLELARALANLALSPLYLADFALRRGALKAELSDLLHSPAPIDPAPSASALERSPRAFVSCAEHSGQIHAVNVVRELQGELARRNLPPATLSGLGGGPLAASGVATLGNPVERAMMGFDGVLSALPYYLDLLERCAAHFRETRPDVAVLVDSPALHVPLGRIARRYGVKVLHFVTPQHWGWAPWRTAGYARSVDRALTILPFEPEWFRRRGVHVAHVGHPLQDRLVGVPRNDARPRSKSLAILPGSRARVIDLNLPWMLTAAARVRERMRDVEVRVLQENPEHRARVAEHIARAHASDWVQLETGDLHTALGRSSAAFSVSGTVLLDLLHHRLPTVCIYRVGKARDTLAYRTLLCTPWFASPNLLAGREVVPEFCFRGRGPLEEVALSLLDCLEDGEPRRAMLRGLDLAAVRLGPPGACQRAALHALDLAARTGP
jgi:lipid-A-disaccharide synthase